MRNIFHLEADYKTPISMPEPVVTQNDSVVFNLAILDKGLPLPLTEMSQATLAHERPDGEVVLTHGTFLGENTIEFLLGGTEFAVTGRVKATAQLYGLDGRASSLQFTYQVIKDPTGTGYVPSDKEKTLIEIVLIEGPMVIQAAKDATLAANTATEAANTATAAADASTQAADAATLAANTATQEANTATSAANTATANADAATLAAQQATTAAITATGEANTAAQAANTATTDARQAIAEAEEATEEGNFQAYQAELAALEANTAKAQTEAATQETILAKQITEAATQAANTAKEDAKLATSAANTATERAEAAALETEGLLPNIRGWEGFTPYDPTVTYKQNNFVTHEGNGYQLKAATSVGIAPKSPEDLNVWLLVVRQGMDGQGTVNSVNGIRADEQGDVKLPIIADYNQLQNIPAAFKPEPHDQGIATITGLQSALDSLSSQIAQIGADGIPKLVSFTYTTPGTEAVGKELTIPLDTFNAATDTLILIKNTTVQYQGSQYTISGAKVILTDALVNPENISFHWIILKNVPIGPNGAISANVLADGSITKAKLEQTIQDAVTKATAALDEAAIQSMVSEGSGAIYIEAPFRTPLNVKRVNGATHINHVPLFTSGLWQRLNGTSIKVIRPDQLAINSTMDDYTFINIYSLIVGKTYHCDLSRDANTAASLEFLDANDVFISGSPAYGPFTVPANTKNVRLILQTKIANQEVKFTAPNIVEGSSWKLFVADIKGVVNPTILNPVNGTRLTIPTTLHTDDYVERNAVGELIKYKKVQERVWDGSEGWQITGTNTGFKQLRYAHSFKANQTVINAVKFDGTIINPTGETFTSGDQVSHLWSTGYVYLSVKNSDSGWGDNYTPTTEEIKAFFLGWKMYQVEGAVAGSIIPYDGTGTKIWAVRLTPGSPYESSQGLVKGTGTQVLPTETPASYGYPYTSWQPYRVIYRLSTPTQEVIQPYGSVILEKGENEIETDAGFIVNEKVPIQAYAGEAYINGTGKPLLRKVMSIDKVHKNNIEDRTTNIIPVVGDADIAKVGIQYVSLPEYDPRASYTVDYVPRYSFQVTAPFDYLEFEYYESLHAAANELMADTMNQHAHITRMLENVVNKNNGIVWITPTLLSGLSLVNQAADLCAYGKDSDGTVYVELFLQGTITAGNMSVFTLPKGYRPSKNLIKPCAHYTDSTTIYSGAVAVYSSGGVQFINNYAANKNVHVLSFSFKAEQ